MAESVEAFRSIYGQGPAALEVLAMQPLHSWKKTADRFLSVNKKID